MKSRANEEKKIPTPETAPREHDVLLDYAGWGRHTRYTCYDKACDGATCLRQPWMDSDTWAEKKAAFFALHPHSKLREDRS